MAAPSTVFTAVRRLPIVVILGATGTGKSKLAIEMGRKLNGEIISADAMQLYCGLDIITNKVTQAEQRQCPHHMIGYVDPHSYYTVTDFRNKAIPIIDGLLHKGKLPIIVGGTNYYIEALLWNILIGEETDTDTLVWEERPFKKLRIRRRDTSQEATTSDSNVARQSASEDRECETLQTGDLASDVSADKVTSGGKDLVGEADPKSRTASNASECDLINRVQEGSSEQRTASEQNEAAGTLRNSSKGDIKEQTGVTQEHQTEKQQSVIETDTSLDSRTSLSECPDVDNGAGTSQETCVQYEEVDVDAADNATLHGILAEIDPERANGLHPNNRRKIIRSLQVYEQQGIRHSELLARQHQQTGASSLSGPLRYHNLCILWLQADTEVLHQRLDARVDDMIEQGLVEELADFHRQHNQKRLESSDVRKEEQYVNGIFQSIGFKEFHDYLILSDQEKTTDEGLKLFKEGVEKMKIATRQYARRQNKWVRNRFVKRPGSAAPSVYSLNTTDPSRWDEIVLQPALDILQAWLQGKNPPVEPVHYEPEPEDSHEVDRKATYVCDVCQGKVIVGWQQWQAHSKSRSHAKRKRKAILRNWEAQQVQPNQQDKEQSN
ncbi:tRNA dimethylallyltransferase-like isoform X3 [Amphiura filiformis]|uniref:tRNA dimethylallyltransferase-like isoform X1 n=2 Tax=Amphiura filiformis TaxID=82378 RepID=UPI003B2138B2